jgi:hypothetical protein
MASAPQVIYRHALHLLARPLGRPAMLLVPDNMDFKTDARKDLALPDVPQRLRTWPALTPAALAELDPSSPPALDSIPRKALVNLVKDRSRRHFRSLQAGMDDFIQLRRFLALSQSTTVCVTAPSMVRIEVSTQQDESLKKTGRTYRVRMSLLASSPHASLTLTHRTLTFEDVNGVVLVHVEKSPKVVGATPELARGGPAFQYFSFMEEAPEKVPFGAAMSGFFHFVDPSKPDAEVLAMIEKTPMLKPKALA